MNKQTLIIDFPLRGEWLTEVSPAYRIPSHGTNRFGLRYAFDFIQSKEKNGRRVTHNSSQIAYFIKGVSLERYYCFNQPVFAPFSGQVVVIENSISDGQKASWFHDQLGAICNSLFFNSERDGFASIAGNYVILKGSDRIYAAFCHLKKDSILVGLGEKVECGQMIARVGHSGNSTEPHLHFHLMDSLDVERANGLPFVFRQYEKWTGSTWEPVRSAIPDRNEKIRFNG